MNSLLEVRNHKTYFIFTKISAARNLEGILMVGFWLVGFRLVFVFVCLFFKVVLNQTIY